MMLTKPKRRQLIFLWAGLVAFWGASLVVVLVLLPNRVLLLAAAGGCIVLGVGGVVTRRVRAPTRRALISVGDLRPGRTRRR